MKYLYYIAGILVVVSVLAGYVLVDTKVEISKPAIVVNDRIITQAELEKLFQSKPYYMTDDQYYDFIISKQLLIQEAVSQEINKEESFRKSVENFYEQSLIKILLDRKSSSLAADASDREIEKYKNLAQSRINISKFTYTTMEQALAKQNPIIQKIESDYLDISDDLKFIVLNLEKGHFSGPFVSNTGVVVYRLDDIKDSGKTRQIDVKRVSLFIRDKKKELLLDGWTKKLKENAEIWRLK